VQTALGGYQSINELILPGGRLRDQRDAAMAAIEQIPGVSCVKPRGAMYLFPKIDLNMHKIRDDQQLVLDFLIQEKVLLVQGTAFNWPRPDHFRIVFLPREDELSRAINRFGEFLSRYTQ
jgi:alanine-synthesizing transaminase